jgi:hypothetical protein
MEIVPCALAQLLHKLCQTKWRNSEVLDLEKKSSDSFFYFSLKKAKIGKILLAT